jgi:hypothetical protein
MFKAGEWAIYAPKKLPRYQYWQNRVGFRLLVVEDEAISPDGLVRVWLEDGAGFLEFGDVRHEVTLNHAYQAVLRRLAVGRATYNERSLALLRQCLSYLETVAQTQQTWLAPYDSAPVLEPIREEIDKALSEADAIRTR